MILMKRRDAGTLRKLRVLLTVSVVCNLTWLTEGSQLRFGYYLWLLSFVFFAVAAHLAVREETTTASAQ
jgi:hypothetical protein